MCLINLCRFMCSAIVSACVCVHVYFYFVSVRDRKRELVIGTLQHFFSMSNLGC